MQESLDKWKYQPGEREREREKEKEKEKEKGKKEVCKNHSVNAKVGEKKEKKISLSSSSLCHFYQSICKCVCVFFWQNKRYEFFLK